MTAPANRQGGTRPPLPDRERIVKELNLIGDPCSVAHGTPLGLVDMGIVGEIQIDRDGKVVVPMRLTSPSCYMVGYFRDQILTRLSTLPGIDSVDVETDLGLDWTPALMSPTAQQRRRESLARRGMVPLVGMQGLADT